MKSSLGPPYPAVVLAEDKEKAVRKKKQEEHEEDYQKALISIYMNLRETEGPDMTETMKDQIRQWFTEYQWVIRSHKDIHIHAPTLRVRVCVCNMLLWTLHFSGRYI